VNKNNTNTKQEQVAGNTVWSHMGREFP